MDQASIEKYLRQILQFVAGIVVAKGWISGETANMVVGVAAAVGIAGWMAFRNTKSQLIANVAALPEVSVIGTTRDLAASIPATEVVDAGRVTVRQ